MDSTPREETVQGRGFRDAIVPHGELDDQRPVDNWGRLIVAAARWDRLTADNDKNAIPRQSCLSAQPRPVDWRCAVAKSPEGGMASLLRNLEEKTGRSMDAWVKIARDAGPMKHGQLVAFLKKEHALTHGYANQIALRALAADDAPPAGSADLVDAQYGGAKAALRPVYDALVAAVRAFGPDTEFAPKKAYVSLRRAKQFGVIQPSTAMRVDVGLVLKGVAPKGRLEASGSFNAMVTHRVRLGSAAEVDRELIAWLRRAYDQA